MGACPLPTALRLAHEYTRNEVCCRNALLTGSPTAGESTHNKDTRRTSTNERTFAISRISQNKHALTCTFLAWETYLHFCANITF